MIAGKDSSIEILKLEDEKSFNEILQHNLKAKSKWNQSYPNHENWIKSVIAELISNNYSRIVFGGFFHDRGKYKLCSSVIIKKNQFANYLEIKNLIVFKLKNKEDSSLIREYQIQLISYIKEFAQKRGFPKLVTELSRKKDKDLINIFLESDFMLTGSQQGRYNNNDEIVFLSYEVNQLYGFDPYDNYSSSLWIIQKYLKCQRIERFEDGIILRFSKKNELEIPSYEFYNGVERSTPPEDKFNSKNVLIILGENFRKANDFGQIESVVIEKKGISKVYIFDFTNNRISATLASSTDNKNLTIFHQKELAKLMGFKDDKELSKQRRFEFKDVGGLFLLSNPELFPFKKADAILNSDFKPFIYIKLGDYGRFVSESTPIVFGYYPKNQNKTSLQIWGVARVNSFPVFNINKIKEGHSEQPQDLAESVGKSTRKDFISDADYLFKEMFEQMTESENELDESTDYEDFEKTILWTKDEFNTHNRYNETNLVIALSVDLFYDLRNKPIQLDKIVEESADFEEIENVFDFYLSNREVEKIFESSEINFKAESNFEEMPNMVNFLYTYALPDDKSRVGVDHDYVQEIFSRDSMIKFATIMDTTFSKLQSAIGKFDIIHFSGHGDKTGLMLVSADNQKTELLTNEEIVELFKNNKKVKLVILNSCYSQSQAELISKYNIYVVAFNDLITSKAAINFSKSFYFGFNKKIKDGYLSALRAGRDNFETEFPDISDLLTIWKNGGQILK